MAQRLPAWILCKIFWHKEKPLYPRTYLDIFPFYNKRFYCTRCKSKFKKDFMSGKYLVDNERTFPTASNIKKEMQQSSYNLAKFYEE